MKKEKFSMRSENHDGNFRKALALGAAGEPVIYRYSTERFFMGN
jgi:hypothetical protein